MKAAAAMVVVVVIVAAQFASSFYSLELVMLQFFHVHRCFTRTLLTHTHLDPAACLACLLACCSSTESFDNFFIKLSFVSFFLLLSRIGTDE